MERSSVIVAECGRNRFLTNSFWNYKASNATNVKNQAKISHYLTPKNWRGEQNVYVYVNFNFNQV